MECAADRMMAIEKKALRLLEDAGYEAYAVGGRVRDALISCAAGEPAAGLAAAKAATDATDAAGSPEAAGLAAQTAPEAVGADIDITTNATPEQVKEVFAGYQTIDTGIKHGTVTVLLPIFEAASERFPVEITTYRSDGSYSDSRHPDQVSFVKSLEEDLARRDFTINAIARDLRGEIVDPFHGIEDIKLRQIRAVGDPEERFQEDALRIMRALRFAASLSFSIEKETAKALSGRKHLLKRMAAERLYMELKKMVVGPDAGRVIRDYTEVLGQVIPELLPMKDFQQHNPYHKYDVLEHCVRAMEAVRTTPENETYMKLAALFHDIGKPLTYSTDEAGIGHFYKHPHKSRELVIEILERLKADRFTVERVATLVKYHDLIFEKDPRLLKRWMNRLTPEVLFEILEIKRADNLATGNMSRELEEKFDEIKEMMAEIVAGGQCFSLKDLAVDGSDLLEMGIPPGPEVGEILDQLLEEVIEGRLPNEKNVLLSQGVVGRRKK
ncbi:MAG: HD domain-containing protein [Bacillota bacterium]|nr:HD domain-containing protein [Bacillota bacterium]